MYTFLNEKGIETKINEVEKSFFDSMTYWEKAINYYLNTGEILRCRIRNLK